jgi:hypothetical protein
MDLVVMEVTMPVMALEFDAMTIMAPIVGPAVKVVREKAIRRRGYTVQITWMPLRGAE